MGLGLSGAKRRTFPDCKLKDLGRSYLGIQRTYGLGFRVPTVLEVVLFGFGLGV